MPKQSVRRSIASKKTLCAKCTKVIKEESDDFIECDKCGKILHSQCSDLSRREFERLLKNENEIYNCQFCKGDDGNIRQELNTIKTELKKLEKLDKLEQLTESINFMSAKFDEVFKDVAENKKKIKDIERENKELKGEIKNLKSSVKTLNDDRVRNNCIISGLKVSNEVKAVDAVVELSKSVGVELQPFAVEDAFFLRGKNRASETKTAVVKFSSKIHKEKLMTAKSKLKDEQGNNELTKLRQIIENYRLQTSVCQKWKCVLQEKRYLEAANY